MRCARSMQPGGVCRTLYLPSKSFDERSVTPYVPVTMNSSNYSFNFFRKYMRPRLSLRSAQWVEHKMFNKPMNDALIKWLRLRKGKPTEEAKAACEELRRVDKVITEDRQERHPVIYYCADKMGNIKIGITRVLHRRLQQFNVYAGGVELLATELGFTELERKRHEQFSAYRIQGEWYRPGKKLKAHIASLPKLQANSVPPLPSHCAQEAVG